MTGSCPNVKFLGQEKEKMLQSILQQKVFYALIYISKIYAERNELYLKTSNIKVLVDIIIIIWIYWYWFNYARTLRGLEKEVFLCFLSVQPWYLLYLKLFSPSALLVLANILNVSKVISSFLSCLKSITALQKIIGRISWVLLYYRFLWCMNKPTMVYEDTTSELLWKEPLESYNL